MAPSSMTGGVEEIDMTPSGIRPRRPDRYYCERDNLLLGNWILSVDRILSWRTRPPQARTLYQHLALWWSLVAVPHKLRTMVPCDCNVTRVTVALILRLRLVCFDINHQDLEFFLRQPLDSVLIPRYSLVNVYLVPLISVPLLRSFHPPHLRDPSHCNARVFQRGSPTSR